MKNRRVNPMASVVVITAAALVGVVVLAVQAAGSAPKVAKALPTVSQPAQPTASQASDQPPPSQPADPNALPADSGSGKRYVYSLGASKVWLVDVSGGKDAVQRVIQVVPSTIVPPAGKYKVTAFHQFGNSSDGVSVAYVVLWGPNAKYGFDAVSGVSGMPPKPTKATGGVRMTQDDALASWAFVGGEFGLPVVVVQ